MVFFPLIAHPAHDFRVRAHVRCGNVRSWPHDVMDLVDKCAGHSLDELSRTDMRVDTDPSLGTAIGQVRDSRFPSHESRQRSYLIQIHGRMVTQPTLHRTARIVVLNAVPDIGGNLPVVTLHRYLDLYLSPGSQQQCPLVLWQLHVVSRADEV